MPIRFLYTTDDLLSGHALFLKSSKAGRKRRQVVLWITAIGVLSLLAVYLTNPVDRLFLLIPLCGYLVWMTLMLFGQQWSFRRTIKNDPRFKSNFEYEMSPAGLSVATSSANAFFQWNHFQEWYEDSKSFIFLSTSRMFHTMPKRVMSEEEIDEMRMRLQSKS